MAETVAKQALKNEKVGHVVSTKMAKTIVVEVSRRVPHPLYKRIVAKRKKFYAHDEDATAKMGDMVRIVECRPLSKLKRWKLAEVIRRAAQVGAAGGVGREGVRNLTQRRRDAEENTVTTPGFGFSASQRLRVKSGADL